MTDIAASLRGSISGRNSATGNSARNSNMMDRLVRRIDELGAPVVVGLDLTIEMIPEGLREARLAEFGPCPRAVAGMFVDFSRGIIDSVRDIVPAVKLQIAMFERYGIDGLSAYVQIADYARRSGLIVIGDIKRGDIASTAGAYAAHLAGVTVGGLRYDPWQEDFITVNPYFGSDGIEPFTDACRETGKGIFVLVMTSNPGSSELQDLALVGNESDGPEEPVYMRVAELAREWGAGLTCECGFSSVGIVVGATHPEVGMKLRAEFPGLFFLVPGYGAQGAGADDLRGLFDNEGRGCLVNSSRGITCAWQHDDRFGLGNAGNAGDAAREAALRMISDIRGVL